MKVNQITDVRSIKLQRGITPESSTTSFRELLHKEKNVASDVQLSKHASQRIEERGIDMNQSVMQKLSHAIERARQKGAKDVVVIGERGAFIVNVPNNIVVTTMTQTEMKENIFTNIDTAVFM